MHVYRRYFMITSGPLMGRVKEINAINKKANEQYSIILKDIGAKEGCFMKHNRITGIRFEGEPDRSLYKKRKYGWWPKKNTKKGKALNKLFKDIVTVDENTALEIVGLSTSPSIFTAGKCYMSTMISIPTPLTVIISTPWYDEDPAKIEKYIEDKKKGNMENNMEVLLWEPNKDMKEVKEWEYLKLISDYNESIKEEQ